MKYRDVLSVVQEHYTAAIIAAVVAAASAMASGAAQNKANRARKRNSANANQIGSQGEMDASAPTALRFADDKGAVSPTRANPSQGQGDTSLSSLPMGARMSDILGSTRPVSEPQQGMSVGVKSLADTAPPPASPQPVTAANPYTEMPPTQTAPPKTDTASAAGQYGGYAQQALQLYMAYDQLKKAGRPEPQPQAQVGQMNLQPTARRFGV